MVSDNPIIYFSVWFGMFCMAGLIAYFFLKAAANQPEED